MPVDKRKEDEHDDKKRISRRIRRQRRRWRQIRLQRRRRRQRRIKGIYDDKDEEVRQWWQSRIKGRRRQSQLSFRITYVFKLEALYNFGTIIDTVFLLCRRRPCLLLCRYHFFLFLCRRIPLVLFLCFSRLLFFFVFVVLSSLSS